MPDVPAKESDASTASSGGFEPAGEAEVETDPAALCGVVARMLAAGGREDIPSVLTLLSQELRADVELQETGPGSPRRAIPMPRIRSSVDVGIETGCDTSTATGGSPAATSLDLPVRFRGALLAVLSVDTSASGLPPGWASDPAPLYTVADLLALALAAGPATVPGTVSATVPAAGTDPRALAHSWFDYEERDRADLAGHLHDGLVQSLIAARYLLDLTAASQPEGAQPSCLAALGDSLREALADGRGLLSSLQPRTRHGRGLRMALEEFSSGSRIPIVLHPSDADADADAAPQLTPVVAAAAYRFAQSAVADLRVRGADAAEVWLGFGPGGLSLDVRAGGDSRLRPDPVGLPLQRWAARLDLLGGSAVLLAASAHLRFSAADGELASTGQFAGGRPNPRRAGSSPPQPEHLHAGRTK